MRKIRIAQEGWRRCNAAESLDEVECGIKVPWIELEVDGQSIRIPPEFIVGVDTHSAGDDFTTVSVKLLGLPEYVPLGADGLELR